MQRCAFRGPHFFATSKYLKKNTGIDVTKGTKFASGYGIYVGD
jgi:hypothetical protein